jgi:hypothetical protein
LSDVGIYAEEDGLPAPPRPARRLLPKIINLKETSNSMSSALYAEELALLGSKDPKQLTDAALRRALKVWLNPDSLGPPSGLTRSLSHRKLFPMLIKISC